MIDNYSSWYKCVSQTKSFKWGRVWLLITILLLSAEIYFCLTGHGLEALMILGFPLFFAASNALEAFTAAARHAAKVQWLTTYYDSFLEDVVDTEAALEVATVAEFEQSEPEKLIACQYYVFLYLLFEQRRTGEKTFEKLANLPAARYRKWLEGLALPDLQLVRKTQGKVEVAQIELAEALKRIADYDNFSLRVWEFPLRVYADPRNWKQYDPQIIEIEPGRTVRVGGKSRPGDTPTLLPIYPTRLTELQF